MEGIETEVKVMKQGDKPVFWKSAEHPAASFLTRIAAAAFAVGFDLLTPKCFQHHVRVDESAHPDPEAEPKRSVTWIWNGNQKVRFRPNFPEEEITVAEFRRRFEDLEWVAKNPDHPISYMRAFLEQSRKTMAQISGEPALLVIRGDEKVIAPPGATAEEIDQAFEDLAEAIGQG